MKKLLNTLHNSIVIQIGIIYLRYLLGLSFILPAIYMNKLSGKSLFQNTDLNNASGLEQFFYVMSHSGLYWKFIGWYQVLTGVLLTTQRFAKLGALLFFAMILNIFLITLSFGFQGTPTITGLMTLASIILILWDMNTLKYIIISPSVEDSLHSSYEGDKFSTHYYWEFLGLVLIIITVILASNRFIMLALIIPFITSLLALSFFLYKNYYKK